MFRPVNPARNMSAWSAFFELFMRANEDAFGGTWGQTKHRFTGLPVCTQFALLAFKQENCTGKVFLSFCSAAEFNTAT